MCKFPSGRFFGPGAPRACAIALAVWVTALGGCSRTADEPPPRASSPPVPRPSATAAAEPPSSPAPSAAQGLHWDAPSRWLAKPPSNPMRVAEYNVPRAAGDPEDGECTVVTFGADQGGGVDQNVDRWVKQFNPLSGPATKVTRQVRGMNVTRVEVAGSYHPMRMPGAPQGDSTIPTARLVGAIVEAPTGLWFFKMTGPDHTVKEAATELDTMVNSAHP